MSLLMTHWMNQNKIEVIKLVEAYTDVLAEVPGKTSPVEHRMPVTNTTPIRS